LNLNTEIESALRTFAKMINLLDVSKLAPILADDFHYTSQTVLEELTTKEAFLEYFSAKFETMRSASALLFAEMATWDAYGGGPCVVLAQYERQNLIGTVVGKVENGKLAALTFCIVPPPQTATRSGDYPI